MNVEEARKITNTKLEEVYQGHLKVIQDFLNGVTTDEICEIIHDKIIRAAKNGDHRISTYVQYEPNGLLNTLVTSLHYVNDKSTNEAVTSILQKHFEGFKINISRDHLRFTSIELEW